MGENRIKVELLVPHSEKRIPEIAALENFAKAFTEHEVGFLVTIREYSDVVALIITDLSAVDIVDVMFERNEGMAVKAMHVQGNHVQFAAGIVVAAKRYYWEEIKKYAVD